MAPSNSLEINAPDELSIEEAAAFFGGDAVRSDLESSLPKNLASQLAAGAITVADSLTFGLGDELVGAGAGGAGYLMGEGSFGDEYSKYRDTARALESRFRGENPGTSFATDVMGGVLSGKALTNLPGAAGRFFSIAPTNTVPGAIKEGAKAGAKYGGAFGFGEGEDGIGSRMMTSLVSSLIGAPVGAGAGGLIQGGANLIAKPLLSKIPNMRIFSSERGAVGEEGAREMAENLNPTQMRILRDVRDLAPEQMEAALATMQKAEAGGVPLTLSEAIPSKSLKRTARKVHNLKSSADVVGDFLDERSALTPERLATEFDRIAPNTTGSEGGGALRQAVSKAQEADLAARRELVNPMFQKAYSDVPQIQDETLQILMESPEVAPFVNSQKKYIAFQRSASSGKAISPDEIAPTDSELVSNVLAMMNREIGPLPNIAPDMPTAQMVDVQKALRGRAYEGNPQLKSARQEWGAQTEGMLSEQGGHTIKSILETPVGREADVARKLMSLPAKELERLTGLLGPDARPAILQSVRGYLQDLMPDTFTGQDVATNILRKQPKLRTKLNILLGEDVTEAVLSGLERERDMMQFSRFVQGGSQTAEKLQDAATEQTLVSSLYNMLTSPIRSGVQAGDEFLTQISFPDELAREMSETLFTNQPRAIQDLMAIIPRHKRVSSLMGTTDRIAESLKNPLVISPGQAFVETTR